MATTKKPSSLDFARAYLRKKPKASFAEIRDAAAEKKLVLYPVSYGRAQALEGLVKVAKYGTKKKAKASGRGPGRPKGSKNKAKASGRGPGRPKGSKNKPRLPARTRIDSIDDLVGTIKNLQQERDRAVDALEKIRNLLDDI